jgi:hypothetical protein
LKQTTADVYYQKHQELPKPSVMHAVLPEATTRALVELTEDDDDDSQQQQQQQQRKNIFVIGDVHGCFDELQALHQKAIVENDNRDFTHVILVGDLVNKGPQSAQVVRFVRTQPHWYSVRGNHDDAALLAALGDAKRSHKKKYRWVLEGENNDIQNLEPQNNHHEDNEDINEDIVTTTITTTLSDEDVEWWSELPYTITIPGSYLGDDTIDTLIVHAGLIPHQDLETQEIDTMITMREVLPICTNNTSPDDDGTIVVTNFEVHERQKGNEAELPHEDIIECSVPLPWASVWKGPQRIIFGHDARRGLQRYDGDWAIGLDTGAVYGKQLTGILLPQRKLISIPTTEHCPPTGKGGAD